MPWTIERKHDHVVVVTMNSNKANVQNPAFFDDLHRAFDRLELEFTDCAVVLTGTGRVFSAGIDFEHNFPLFARRSLAEIDAWFEAYRATNLRLFTYPRPTVAAINGHAYAGGLITALNCDYRVAADGPFQFALNEVPIGIPMPAAYVEIIKHALGSAVAHEVTLFGQVYDLDAALRLGVMRKSVSADRLIAEAWNGPDRSIRIATRPMHSRSEPCKQRRLPQSTRQRGLIGIGCPVACRIREACAPTHAATAN